jgi:hypothetical protein
MEMRCLKQQELCQLLMRAERFDEALQVAHNVYKTDQGNKERCAAHHFLLAEIYNRKMKASRSLDEMEKNRQFALSAAQEVVEQKYPAKWGVSEHARALIRQLNDSSSMGIVRQRVESRAGSGDTAKEAIAEAQRKYLDATQGGGRAASAIGTQTPKSSFRRVQPAQTEVQVSQPNAEATVATAEVTPRQAGGSLRSSPEVTRTLSPGRYTSGESFTASDRLNKSGLLTSQPSTPRTTVKTLSSRQPIMVNGTAVTPTDPSVDIVVQNNLAHLLEAARKRKENSRSPYATGELPSTTVR